MGESMGRIFDRTISDNSRGFTVSSLLRVGHKREAGQLESGEGKTIFISLIKISIRC